jgi:hypothetical protein
LFRDTWSLKSSGGSRPVEAEHEQPQKENAAFFASGAILIFPAAIAITHYVIR